MAAVWSAFLFLFWCISKVFLFSLMSLLDSRAIWPLAAVMHCRPEPWNGNELWYQPNASKKGTFFITKGQICVKKWGEETRGRSDCQHVSLVLLHAAWMQLWRVTTAPQPWVGTDIRSFIDFHICFENVWKIVLRLNALAKSFQASVDLLVEVCLSSSHIPWSFYEKFRHDIDALIIIFIFFLKVSCLVFAFIWD